VPAPAPRAPSAPCPTPASSPRPDAARAVHPRQVHPLPRPRDVRRGTARAVRRHQLRAARSIERSRDKVLSWAGRAVTVARPGSARLGAGGDSDEEGAVGWRRGTVGSEKRRIAVGTAWPRTSPQIA